MRNSKRILALALALLMVIGMFTTVSARNAADMPDYGDVTARYRTAVGVLMGMGIVQGRNVGTGTPVIAPQGDVQRAEVVTMIFRMVNAGEAPPTGGQQVFTDVGPNHWAFSYISWAYEQGIVAGHGDGTFAPAANVTVTQAAAMLLRTLGWGVHGEFTGTGWNTRVNATATTEGLYAVLVQGNLNTTSTANREQVMQMTYNALSMRRVTYTPAAGYSEWTAGGRFGRVGFGYYVNNGLPVDTALRGVVLNGLPIGRNNNVTFNELDADGHYDATTALDLAGIATITATSFNYAEASIYQVGRVGNIHMNRNTGQVFYFEAVSQDINVAPRTADAATRTALGITASTVANSNRSDDIQLFQGYDVENSVTQTLTLDMTNGQRTNLLWHMPVTYVLYNDVIVSAVFPDRWVADVTVGGSLQARTITLNRSDITTGAVAVVGAALVPASEITNQSSVNLTVPGRSFVNVEFRGRYGSSNQNYILTDVETVTGRVVGASNNTITGTFRLLGDTRWLSYVGPGLDDGTNVFGPNPPIAPVPGITFNQTSQEIANVNNATDVAALVDAMQALQSASPDMRAFTAYISGVTGQVMALELARGDAATAQLVFVRQATTNFDAQGNRFFQANVIFGDGSIEWIYTNVFLGANDTGAPTNDTAETGRNVVGQAVWLTVSGDLYNFDNARSAIGAGTFPAPAVAPDAMVYALGGVPASYMNMNAPQFFNDGGAVNFFVGPNTQFVYLNAAPAPARTIYTTATGAHFMTIGPSDANGALAIANAFWTAPDPIPGTNTAIIDTIFLILQP